MVLYKGIMMMELTCSRLVVGIQLNLCWTLPLSIQNVKAGVT